MVSATTTRSSMDLTPWTPLNIYHNQRAHSTMALQQGTLTMCSSLNLPRANSIVALCLCNLTMEFDLPFMGIDHLDQCKKTKRINHSLTESRLTQQVPVNIVIVGWCLHEFIKIRFCGFSKLGFHVKLCVL